MTENAVAVPSAPLAAIPHWLVPNSIGDVEKIAAKMCAADWVPKSYRDKNQEINRAKVELAIMHGATVGIPAIMAPQVIAVINGMPSIWGDGMMGLVESSGLMEDIDEFMEGEGENLTAVCIVKRKGITTPGEGKFSVAMAKRAGLWTKEGPWQTYPARMLKMRARSYALRDRFADVLKGLRMTEEVLDELIDVTPSGEAPERPKREDFDRRPIDIEEERPRRRRRQAEPTPTPERQNTATNRQVDEPAPTPAPVPEPEPSTVEPPLNAFTLISGDGEELPYEDPADFKTAYLKHFHEALKDYGMDGAKGYIESNDKVFIAWTAKNPGTSGEIALIVNAAMATPMPAPPANPANRQLFT